MGNTVQPVVVQAATESRARFQRAYSQDYLRSQFNHLYWTKEDFSRTDPDLRRVVFIGCTGSGKSTLLNIMGGWRYVQRPPDYDFTWESASGQAPIFAASAGSQSVTSRTEFACLHWQGNEQRPFIAIDTPGHDDTESADLSDPSCRDRLSTLAVDLHDKLKAIGHVHAIVVMHNDVLSNRLNPATYKILKMIDQKFAQSDQTVWNNTTIVYSKCNQNETAWRAQLAQKKQNLQACIRAKIPNCTVDVPVFALGGATLGDEIGARGHDTERRARSRSPRRGSATDDFEQLWRFVEGAQPLDTVNLQPYDGDDVKWQKMIDERDSAEARAKAAMIYVVVVAKLAALALFLFWRSFFVPEMISRTLFLNMPGPIDEVVYFALLAYWIGPVDVMYSCNHFYHYWIQPMVVVAWQWIQSEMPRPHQD